MNKERIINTILSLVLLFLGYTGYKLYDQNAKQIEQITIEKQKIEDKIDSIYVQVDSLNVKIDTLNKSSY